MNKRAQSLKTPEPSYEDPSSSSPRERTGLRGCTADIVILEEAAFMEPEIFFQVVTPLLGVRNTALLAITTPSDEFNYFSRLMELKDQYEQRLFLVKQLGMTCDACLAANVPCYHRLDLTPFWRPPELMAKCDAIMSANPAQRDREIRGTMKSTKTYVLKPKVVDELEARELFRFSPNFPQVLYSGIDPANGGEGSQYAVMTMAAIGDGGKAVVSLHSATCGGTLRSARQ